MKGFIPQEKKVVQKKANTRKITGCETCAAYKNCSHGKLGITGEGELEILIIGDQVSRREDRSGVPFSDISASYLREELNNIGINLERDCWMINSIQCYSTKVTPNMLEGCRLRLDKTIRDLKPKKILLLGEQACNMFLQERIKKSRISSGNPERFYGMVAPDQEYDCWVMADYHPSFVLNSLVEKRKILKKYNNFREKKDVKLWHHPQLIKADDFRIRSLYFKKYLRTILHKEEFKKVDYRKQCAFIDNVEEAISCMRVLMKEKVLSMDSETNCLLPWREDSKILCLSFATHEFGYSFPIFKDNPRFMRLLKKLLTSQEIMIIIANFTFDYLFIRQKLGFEVTNCGWDICLAAHIIAPTVVKNTSLKVNAYTCDGVLGYDASVEPYIKGANKKDPYSLNTLEELTDIEVGLYNAEDSLHTQRIAYKQMAIINSNPKLKNIFRLYMEAQVMYAEMAFKGIRVDESKLIKNEMILDEQLHEIEYKMKNCVELQKWYDIHTNEFNFNSNEQLSEFFFDILGLSTNKKTHSGASSIDKTVIEELGRHSELASLLAEYKKVFKLKNTDLNNIKKHIHNGRLHASIGVATTSTGRSNSSNPNLQNTDGSDYGLEMIRSCFLAEEGEEFGAWDFKSLEVITSVGISKDPVGIEELEDPDNNDKHTIITKQFFGEDLHEAAVYMLKCKDGKENHSEEEIKTFIKEETRQLVKSANFALQYFGGASRVYTTLFVESFKEYHIKWFNHLGYTDESKRRALCKSIYDYYWERYSVLRKYIEKVWEEYLTKGYVYNKFGFRINGLVGKTFISNFDSQGSGFVVSLLGNLKLRAILKEKHYKTTMLLTIHDSLECSIDPKEFFDGALEKDIKFALEEYLNKKIRWLEIPLTITPEYYDKNWGVECDRIVWENRYKKGRPE